MNWFKNMFAPSVETKPEIVEGLPFVSERPPSRASFHVARFKRALAQCQNSAKRPELEKWLEYYEDLEAAEAKRGI